MSLEQNPHLPEVSDNGVQAETNDISSLLDEFDIAETDKVLFIQLFSDIDQSLIDDYGIQAMKSLLAELPLSAIQPEYILDEINFLKKNVYKEETEEYKEEKISMNLTEKDNKKQKWSQIFDNYLSIGDEYKVTTGTDEYISYTKLYQSSINNLSLPSFVNQDDYLQVWFTAEKYAQSLQEGDNVEDALTFIQDFNRLNRSLDINYQIKLPGMKEHPPGGGDSLRDVIHDPNILRTNSSVSGYVRGLSLPEITDEEIEKKAGDVSQGLVDNILHEHGAEYYPQLFAYISQALDPDMLISSSAPTSKDARNRQMEEWYTAYGQEQVDELYTSLSKQLTAQHVLTMYQRNQKESVVHGAIHGLAQYFDSRNIRGENYARDFKLDTNNDISIDNNILHINGTMHGQIVHFFYNLQTGELEANDYIHHLYQGDVFAVNDLKNGRVTLPQSLPTIGSLLDDTSAIGSSNLSTGIASIEDYQQKTQSVLDKKLSQTLTPDPLNRLYVARTNEKNLFMQETVDLVDGLLTLGGEHSLDNVVSSQTVSRQRLPEVYRLLNVVDTTVLMTRNIDEIRYMRNLIERLTFLAHTRKINEGRHPDSFVNAVFSRNARETQASSWEGSEQKSVPLLDFFLMISSKSQFGGAIDSSLLQRVVDGIERGEKLDPNILPVHGQELYEGIMTDDPDSLLDDWE